jgi:predicted RND superfamily exporter protein
MVPVTFAILMNFLAMVLLDIDLDIATSLIAGMALGIGIDDTIHFAMTLKDNAATTSNLRKAVEVTLRTSGRDIILTSIALIAAFLTYFASGFVPIIHFGFLNTLTLVTTTFAAMVILPALFLWVGIDRLGWSKSKSMQEQVAVAK